MSEQTNTPPTADELAEVERLRGGIEAMQAPLADLAQYLSGVLDSYGLTPEVVAELVKRAELARAKGQGE